MSDWSTLYISDLGKVVTGKTPPSAKPQQFGAEYPFITPSDMKFREKHIATERFLSDQGLQAHKRVVLPRKSVCVVCIGATIGKVCVTNGPSISNQQINSIIVDKTKHDPDFVYYLASLLRGTLESYAGGAATPIINKGSFSKIKLRVPERETQRKIAAILAAYDDLIEHNRQRIGLLEKMAEEIYREWFVRLRFPGHEHTPVHKGVPEGWEVREIGKVCSTFLGGTPDRSFPAYWDGDIPWINSGEVNKTRIFEPSELITELGLVESATKIMPVGTVVLAITGATLGQVSRLEIECCANQSVVGIYDQKGHYNEWLYFYISFAIEGIIAFASGGAQQHINKKIVDSHKLLIPSKQLVEEFKELVRPIFDHAIALERQNSLLSKTRDLLLNRLISGKLRVDDLDIKFPPSMQEAA